MLIISMCIKMIDPDPSKITSPLNAVVFLSGPPRAGKDKLAMNICSYFNSHGRVKATIFSYCNLLKRITHLKYGSLHGIKPLPYDYFENCKDVPHELFFGQTPRNTYIQVSTNLKAAHGSDFLALRLAARIQKFFSNGISKPKIALVADTGFAEEIEPVLNLEPNASALIRVHREGRGFSSDCRRWVVTSKGMQNFGRYFPGQPVSETPRVIDELDVVNLEQELDLSGRMAVQWLEEKFRMPTVSPVSNCPPGGS